MECIMATASPCSQAITSLLAVLKASLLTTIALFFSLSANAAVNAGDQYILGPEDQLRISVWNEEDLDRIVVVRPDGRISFPLVGELMAAGKSVGHVRDEITKRVRRYIPKAIASVSMEKVAGYRIYVIGKVNSPGQYILGSYVDVIQALTLADGLNPYADEKNIKIIRRKNNKDVIHSFSYDDIKKGKSLSKNITLISGDVVVVP